MAEDVASAFQEKSKEKAFPYCCSMPKHVVIKVVKKTDCSAILRY